MRRYATIRIYPYAAHPGTYSGWPQHACKSPPYAVLKPGSSAKINLPVAAYTQLKRTSTLAPGWCWLVPVWLSAHKVCAGRTEDARTGAWLRAETSLG